MDFNLNKNMSRLILFQRNEIMTSFQKKLRKLFGRYLFTQFFSYLNDKDLISKEYYKISLKEYLFLKNFFRKNDKNILSIGAGIGGVESIILSRHENFNLDMIERNFISTKIKYFWNPNEAYNKLSLTKEFINLNSNNDNFKIFDFKNLDLIEKRYDIIFSLFSMDYHYDLKSYKSFLQKNSHKQTLFIFDTIRAKDLKFFFNHVQVLENVNKEIHSHSRVLCKEIIE